MRQSAQGGFVTSSRVGGCDEIVSCTGDAYVHYPLFLSNLPAPDFLEDFSSNDVIQEYIR